MNQSLEIHGRVGAKDLVVDHFHGNRGGRLAGQDGHRGRHACATGRAGFKIQHNSARSGRGETDIEAAGLRAGVLRNCGRDEFEGDDREIIIINQHARSRLGEIKRPHAEGVGPGSVEERVVGRQHGEGVRGLIGRNRNDGWPGQGERVLDPDKNIKRLGAGDAARDGDTNGEAFAHAMGLKREREWRRRFVNQCEQGIVWKIIRRLRADARDAGSFRHGIFRKLDAEVGKARPGEDGDLGRRQQPGRVAVREADGHGGIRAAITADSALDGCGTLSQGERGQFNLELRCHIHRSFRSGVIVRFRRLGHEVERIHGHVQPAWLGGQVRWVKDRLRAREKAGHGQRVGHAKIPERDAPGDAVGKDDALHPRDIGESERSAVGHGPTRLHRRAGNEPCRRRKSCDGEIRQWR